MKMRTEFAAFSYAKGNGNIFIVFEKQWFWDLSRLHTSPRVTPHNNNSTVLVTHTTT